MVQQVGESSWALVRPGMVGRFNGIISTNKTLHTFDTKVHRTAQSIRSLTMCRCADVHARPHACSCMRVAVVPCSNAHTFAYTPILHADSHNKSAVLQPFPF